MPISQNNIIQQGQWSLQFSLQYKDACFQSTVTCILNVKSLNFLGCTHAWDQHVAPICCLKHAIQPTKWTGTNEMNKVFLVYVF